MVGNQYDLVPSGLIRLIKGGFNRGVYLMPAFNRFDLIGEIVEDIRLLSLVKGQAVSAQGKAWVDR